MHEVHVRKNGVYLGESKVGTIWRQFPIFETTGVLEELVVAAQDGTVRMVPEFCSLGNKVWFSAYRRYRDFFSARIPACHRAILDELIPDSHLVCSSDSFPINIAGHRIGN